MTDDITLPPLPHRALRPGAGDDAMTNYARAAVMLDRQRAAPSAEPCPHIRSSGTGEWATHWCALAEQPAPSAEPVGFLIQLALGWAQRETEKVVKLTRHSQPEHGFTEPLYTTPPDYTAAMQQALDALSKFHRSTGWGDDCLRAVDALRAALEGRG